MREIKFRAWDKDCKVMEYDPLIKNGKYFEIIGNDIWGTSDDYILMQYTNLKDKNDKEIYESDVVADQYGYRFEIVFRDGCWFAGNSEVGFSPKDTWNVIGNIYEDSHLLDNSKDK